MFKIHFCSVKFMRDPKIITLNCIKKKKKIKLKATDTMLSELCTN